MTLDSIVREWVLSKKAMIKASLMKRGKQWAVELDEDADVIEYDSGSKNWNQLDEAVAWTVEKTKDWPGCTRMAYDQWFFKEKREAEKFITLFTLSWQQ